MHHTNVGHGQGVRNTVGLFDVITGFHGLLRLGDAIGGILTLNRLISDYVTVNVQLASTTASSLNGMTTINGAMTVNTGPVVFNTTVAGLPAVANNDFVTKYYVDTLFGSGGMVFLEPARGFYDVSVGDPPGVWVDGQRVIQTVTAGVFTYNWIYVRSGGVWVATIEDPPLSGYSLNTTDAPWTGQWIYNAAMILWTRFTLDHNVLLNHGVYTHAQIDDHISNPASPLAHLWLGQDVRTTAYPSFVEISTTGSAAYLHYDVQSLISTFTGAGPTTVATWTPQAAGTRGVWQVELRAEGVSTGLSGTVTIKKLYRVISTGVVATVVEIDSSTYLTGNLSVVGVNGDLVAVGGTVQTRVTGATAITSSWATRISAVGVQLP